MAPPTQVTKLLSRKFIWRRIRHVTGARVAPDAVECLVARLEEDFEALMLRLHRVHRQEWADLVWQGLPDCPPVVRERHVLGAFAEPDEDDLDVDPMLGMG